MFSAEDYLIHHGIKGQKWGVRRYQNADGSLTAAGKSRYNTDGDKKDYYKQNAGALLRAAREKGKYDIRFMELVQNEETADGESLLDNRKALYSEYKKFLDDTDRYERDLNVRQEERAARIREMNARREKGR